MSLSSAYFDAMYAASPDPWALADRWYEQRKYALTLGSLRRPRYRRAFEPGCSVGVLSRGLAERCDSLLSVDRSAVAVRAARERLAGQPGVRVEQWALPDWPPGRFDLVVLSEVAYYFEEPELARLLDSAVSSLEPGGDLVAVHWRPRVPEYPGTGDSVHAAIAARPELARVARHVELDFVLEVYARTPPDARSVAEAEGLC